MFRTDRAKLHREKDYWYSIFFLCTFLILIIVSAIHVDEFVSIAPISARSVCDWLIVATSFLQQETDMFLSYDANVKNDGRLKEVRDNVNIEKEIMLEP